MNKKTIIDKLAIIKQELDNNKYLTNAEINVIAAKLFPKAKHVNTIMPSIGANSYKINISIVLSNTKDLNITIYYIDDIIKHRLLIRASEIYNVD